jgi:hypothetical protein
MTVPVRVVAHIPSNKRMLQWLRRHNIRGVSRFKRKRLTAVYCATLGRLYPQLQCPFDTQGVRRAYH